MKRETNKIGMAKLFEMHRYNVTLFLFKKRKKKHHLCYISLKFFLYKIELMPMLCALNCIFLAFELNVGWTINFIVKFKIEIEQITSMHLNELMTKHATQCCVCLCIRKQTQICSYTIHSVNQITTYIDCGSCNKKIKFFTRKKNSLHKQKKKKLK